MTVVIMEKYLNATEFTRLRRFFEDCREELRDALEERVLFRVYKNLPLPVIEGRELLARIPR
ncbi:MAG TPA: hypothetical protein PLK94_06880 [Alphaproteobacteria bacterium]|nr:hypothetical protein [Alphaproteobacteria bacterium]